MCFFFFFFNDTATTEIYTLSLHDALPIYPTHIASGPCAPDPTTCDDARSVFAKYRIAFPDRLSETPKPGDPVFRRVERSEEHTSELQSRLHLVCRLLLEKKKHTSSGQTVC